MFDSAPAAAILAAATRLWGERGYHAVSLRRIAESAGVSLALIHHHFGRKDQLFDAAVQAGRDSFVCAQHDLSLVAANASSKTLEDLVASFLSPMLAIQQAQHGQAYLRLVFRHADDPLPEVRTVLDKLLGPLLATLTRRLETLFPDRPALLSACAPRLLLGAVMTLQANWLETGSQGPFARDEVFAALRRYLVGGIGALMQETTGER